MRAPSERRRERVIQSTVTLTACCVVLLLGLRAAPSFAGLEEGLEAYDAGDYATAAEEWQPAADAGDVEAQLALAGLLMQGLGVARDPVEAARYYRKAAGQGDPVAQLNLGDLYAKGLGVQRDLALAACWLRRAADQGRRWAATRLDEIMILLSTAERTRLSALRAAGSATCG